VRPGGRWRGITLANTLPRLTALEELKVTAYATTNSDDYDDCAIEGGMFWEAYWAGGEFQHAEPIPAAPLLAALPNLRRCEAAYVRTNRDYAKGYNFGQSYRAPPMLLATPGELATLRAPRLESLLLGLVTSSDAEGEAWRCNSDCCNSGGGGDGAAQGGSAAGAAANATAAATAVGAGSGLPALRSLELHVGCCCHASAGDSSSWDLSGLAPGSLPALRRLLVLPISFKRRAAMLPLDAVSRAASSLERLVIDPRCAGPLDALFCNDGGGCALSLRGVVLLPPLDAAAPARIDAELRSGLRARAAAGAAAPIKVTLLVSGYDPHPAAAAQLPVSSEYARGATVVQRQLNVDDDEYLRRFLGRMLCRSLPWLICISAAEFEREYL
jgi:hypothetical protein